MVQPTGDHKLLEHRGGALYISMNLSKDQDTKDSEFSNRNFGI